MKVVGSEKIHSMTSPSPSSTKRGVAGKMAQQLLALAALGEDPDSIPSTYTV